MSHNYVYEVMMVTWNKTIKVHDKNFENISQEGRIAFTVNIGMCLSIYYESVNASQLRFGPF